MPTNIFMLWMYFLFPSRSFNPEVIKGVLYIFMFNTLNPAVDLKLIRITD